MNETPRNKLLSILALASALLIPALLPHSAHGMYDPKHGRWLQRDPMGVTVEDGAGVPNPNRQYRDGGNLYQYVKSRPVRHADPYGRCVCKVESFNVNVASTLTKENKTIEIDGEPLYIGQHVSREFTAEASFVKNGGSHCCEYRQFVKGTYKRNGRVVREMPILQEDCATVDGWPTPGGQMCYGHRWEGINTAYDTYFDRPPPYADDRKFSPGGLK